MLGWIEPPRVGAEAEERDDLVRDPLLPVDREVAAQKRVICLRLAQLGDQRDQVSLDLVEDLRDLCGRRLGLEVVKEDVVGLVHALEALDVASPQLEVPLESRQK